MLLRLEEIHTYYTTSHILFGITLEVAEGKAVALLGRNGAGKTTTLRSIMGLAPARQGKVIFLDKEITRQPVYLISRMGIGYVPEDRMIFPDLTVWENLSLGMNRQIKGKYTIETAYRIFPILEKMKNRPAGMTSGGEQQMLTIARSLMTNPKLLLLDEPLEGLSPLVIQELSRSIRHLKEKEGLNILLCEQNVAFATDLCDWIYIIDKGTIRFHGSAADFNGNQQVREEFLLARGRRKGKISGSSS
jgi:branched-chain amino acid transport system ATP-binding protein